jgi:hypothetical protein
MSSSQVGLERTGGECEALPTAQFTSTINYDEPACGLSNDLFISVCPDSVRVGVRDGDRRYLVWTYSED